MRDRLRVNYQWTARQRQVLALIARGKTNTQIGEELGISLDGAKWHVSEILSKLQAESREEAGDYWRRYNGLAPRFERIFRGLAGGATLKIVAGAAGVVLVGAAATAIVAIATNQGNDEPVTGKPNDPAPVVTPPPGGGPTDPGSPRQLSLLPGVQGIPNSVMYTVTGCFQCDGNDVSLQRHVADGNGTLISTTLLEDGKGLLVGWGIGQFRAAPDGSVVAAIACDGQYCGALGGEKPVSNWRIITSTESGATWSTAYEFRASYAWIESVAPEIHYESPGPAGLLVGVLEGDEAPVQYVVVAGGASRAVNRPSGLDVGARPVLRPDNSTLWANLNADQGFLGLLEEDGTAVASEIPEGLTVAYQGITVTLDGTIVVVRDTDGWRGYVLDHDGTIREVVDLGAAYRAAFSSAKLGVGNADGYSLGQGEAGSSYPVLLDLGNGHLQPIMADVFAQGDRNTFIAFQQGAFATVASGRDCLNVRDSASTSATSLACYKDGVLLRDLGETTEAGGVTWLKVATPDGRQGWASTEFLER